MEYKERKRKLLELQQALNFTTEIIEERKRLKLKSNKQLQNDVKDLEKLVSKILEYVLSNNFKLKESEVDAKYTKEYLYILTDIEVAGDGVYLSKIFENSSALVTCIWKNTSINKKQELINEIIRDNYIFKNYDYYCNEDN